MTTLDLKTAAFKFQDPILWTNFDVDFYSKLDFDQSEKPQLTDVIGRTPE